MRHILALACIAAGLAGVAAANEPVNCTTYLMGVWKLETDGDPVTVTFGADDIFKKTTPAGDEWGKWKATDGEDMASCNVVAVGPNGRDQHVVFKAIDENTFSHELKIYRRQRNTAD